MVNKEKLLLLATISMLLPGAMPDAFADGTVEPQTKAKRAAVAAEATNGQHQALASQKSTNNQGLDQ